MLRKIVHLFFIITGATVGYVYVPEIIHLLGITDVAWLQSAYLGLVVGAVIFFVISYLITDYIIGFLKWVEEALIKIPLGDLAFGTLGLIVGLFVAYLINITIQDINIRVVSQVIPPFIMITLGYLGFQVGFRRREEFVQLLSTKKDREKKTCHT